MERDKSAERMLALVFLVLMALSVGTECLAQTREGPKIFGYFSTRYEKTWNEPSLQDDGSLFRETSPGEWTFPFFNLMIQQNVGEKFKIYININGSGADELDLRNFWGEYSVSKELNIRLGKTYRRFDLYNEILDAVPTYYGIEPPELFDNDHLIVSRTTVLMVHGSIDAGPGSLNYSASTDNGEGGASLDSTPFGYDLNYKLFSAEGDFTLGLSGYTSGGPTTPDIDVGEGSPKSGVLPWMAEDDFWVFGGYAEAVVQQWTLQGAYWKSAHTAVRDTGRTVRMIEGGNPNSSQRSRFLLDPNGPLSEANIDPIGDYDICTWYTRVGYSLESKVGEFGPYFQWDYYSNPETIKKKTFGGDNEAGAADDGKFDKWTLGLVYRPVPEVALKFDSSGHMYKVGGQDIDYKEVRFDVSYVFGQ